MVRMKILRTKKITHIALGVAALLLVSYFLPEYHPATPASQKAAQAAAMQSAEQTARAEIAAVPAQAPLTLLTEPDDGVAAVHTAIAQAKTSLALVIYELEDA